MARAIEGKKRVLFLAIPPFVICPECKITMSVPRPPWDADWSTVIAIHASGVECPNAGKRFLLTIPYIEGWEVTDWREVKVRRAT
jgi:hypothetical protein